MLDRLEVICRELCGKWEVGLEQFGGEADHIRLMLDMHQSACQEGIFATPESVLLEAGTVDKGILPDHRWRYAIGSAQGIYQKQERPEK